MERTPLDQMGATCPMPAIEELLAQRIPFWHNLIAAEKQDLVRSARVARFAAGEHVQGAGTGCAGVIFMLSGSLRAYLLDESGKEVTLFRVGPRECCVLAASCIMPMITFDIALDAAESAELIVIDAASFGRVAQSSVHAEAFTYRQATERFSDCIWVMQQVLFMSFDRRLAVFLSDELARNGQTRIGMTHDQIARHLGTAREVVSRMLKYFEQEGIVELGRGSVTVLDRTRLRNLAASA
ncbi:Crp/Fnr family transcriptional regulator [Enorma massiliensis]|uniref:Crp/Fnr family transcriptional regulator n=1 Tax=Enorma massiliensis TaxID=1472761 RepID=UPI0023F54165|nr:Crp/Fnr family transcriptional regulator [Enorma massiliensis]